MRLPPLTPETLSPELRKVHDEIAALVARTQERIVVLNAQGALIGPFPAMLHFPQFGVPALIFQRSLSSEARLPKTVREVAILTVGAAFGARYELYAHEITAEEVGLSHSQIATLAAGNCPSEFNDEEAIAYDVARVLTTGHILPASTYARAHEVLGQEGVGELVFLIGGYCLIATLLNAFDVPVPETDA
ncbi:carboxymuconolactone decarboxylase family protein [Nostoc sp.]|uniref:carboxymuconolactone decarboxylase family protein n=1 Tax=Nostoc sp. TaxID=1180 RepID=UPI002FF48DA3